MDALAQVVANDTSIVENPPFPPLDVAMFWHSHMRSPTRYAENMQRRYGRTFVRINVPLLCLAHMDDHADLEAAREFWAAHMPTNQPLGPTPAAIDETKVTGKVQCPSCKNEQAMHDRTAGTQTHPKTRTIFGKQHAHRADVAMLFNKTTWAKHVATLPALSPATSLKTGISTMAQVDTMPTATTTATPATTTITTNGQDLDRCVIRSRIPESAVQFPLSIPVGRHLFERLRTHDPESLFMAHTEDPDHRITVAALNPQTTVQGTAHWLLETQPHAMIVHSSLYQTARGVIDLAKLTHEPRVILLDSPTTPQLAAITNNVLLMHDLMVPGQVELPSTIAQVQLDETVYLMFTSGTTGSTKAVQMTHHMLRATMMRFPALKLASTALAASAARPINTSKAATSTGATTRYDGALSFFHASGKFLCINAANRSCPIYFFDHFTTGGWLEADPRTKECNLSSLKLIITVSAALSKTLQMQAMKLFKAGVIQSYGSTEALSIALPHFGGSSPLRPGVAGWLKPGNEALLLDLATQTPIPINPNGVTGPGELVVLGPCVMSNTTGYFNRPEETKAAFIWIGGRPWYQMRDVVQIDADGCMTCLDGIHEKFVRMGNHVVLSEVEAEILTVDGVLDAVVVPICRAGSMEAEDPLPCAAVVPRSTAVFTDAKAQQKLTMQIVTAVAKALPSHDHLDGGSSILKQFRATKRANKLLRDARELVVDMLKGMGKAE
ncbi:hypothetical protein GGF31_002125 [Allomyces arbusculus]|nr:hypothetical protein GGF31_002125 [Allomyces arbusculus]